jgi:NAD(P)-dependent dehydrogenase (short-subunit alcohol dehydrogenase family)
MSTNDTRKRGRVALVTGAAQGLGLAFAKRLASEGATVIAVDRTPSPALATELCQSGAASADFHPVDVSDELQVERLGKAVLEKYDRCDIIVNNAGISPNQPFLEITLQDWRWVMAVNVDSMFLVCRALAPAMIKHRYGRVVNITSNTLGLVIGGFAHYIASKGAVVGFTRAIATDLAPYGVTANCIAPGLTQTPQTMGQFSSGEMFEHFAQLQAIKRSELPTDLVGAMSFLTSDDAAFVTGQTLIVDGGLLRSL